MTAFLTAGLDAPHGFFTRDGGVSRGPYASLNCGRGADDPQAVAENRARAARALGAAPAALRMVRQVHGARVAHITDHAAPDAADEADAMVTAHPGVALGIVTADCAPVLFVDRRRRVVGAAHAGWRGACAGVLEATVAAMRDLGAAAIEAAIGPCIHQQSYEVRVDLRDAVTAGDPDDARFFTEGRPGHWQFDLPGYCAARLEAVGVRPVVTEFDTCADPERFFSHRWRTVNGQGPGGHQISIIVCPDIVFQE